MANQNDDDTHYTSLDLMKPKQMRKITFIMLYCWYVVVGWVTLPPWVRIILRLSKLWVSFGSSLVKIRKLLE